MKKHLLVIEDNPEVRENLEDILMLSGYNVTSAADGKQGVEKVIENKPDLILCDVMMPVLDGFGVLNILSKRTDTYNIPFIFLTAKNENEDIRRGMTLGADDYITKPFYKDELLRVIEIRLKKSERLRQNSIVDTNIHSFINVAKGQEALDKLSEEHRQRNYNRKETIFIEGDYPRYLYQLKKGAVKIFKTNEYSKELILKTIKIGDFFGYTPLIENSDYKFSAAATEDCVLSIVPREEFIQLLYSNRDVSSCLIKMLANNVANKEAQLLSLAYSSVRKRTAEALLLLHKEQGNKEPLSVLREDLARMVGTAKESVVRVLTEFKNDGYIDIYNGDINIINKEKLENMPG